MQYPFIGLPEVSISNEISDRCSRQELDLVTGSKLLLSRSVTRPRIEYKLVNFTLHKLSFSDVAFCN